MKRLLALSITSVAAVAAIAAVNPVSAKEFYEGKKINCIVPYSPGGGTDSFFRVIVPNIARLIPGKPDIVIRNMSGAGGLKANNYVSQDAPNDGFTVLCAPWLSSAQMTRRKGVRFDYSKMRLVGGESAIDTSVISKKIVPGGLKNAAQATKAKRIVIGGLSPSSTLDLRLRLAADLLGLKTVYIPGYRGQAKQVPAFLSGEISMVGANYGTYASRSKQALVDNGPGMLFAYFPKFDSAGKVKPSALMDKLGVPRLDVLYKKVHGKNPSGQLWEAYKTLQNITAMGLSMWLPKGSPDAALKALRAGWYALPKDEKFRKHHLKSFQKEVNFLPKSSAHECGKCFQGYIAKGEK